MSRFATEKSLDENTGLDCWLVIDTLTGVVIDRAFDREDARDIADYYQDRDAEPLEIDEFDEYEDDGQPDEFTEWQDFDPDC